MRFRGLDLNLLVAFDALLTTRSVSRAAERLNLSQPAMSAALGRLRDYFRDDILVAQGKRMHPTAYAVSLHARVQEALVGIESLVTASAVFDPSTSDRTFRIAASDYILVAVLAPVAARLASLAPGVRIDFLLPNEDSTHHLNEGKIDLLVAPDNFVHRDHPADLLFEETHVLVGWRDNDSLREGLSEDEFYDLGHVVVAFGAPRTPSFVDRQIELRGRPRRAEVVASSFTALPWLLFGTPRIAAMHARLAEALVSRFPLKSVSMPFDLPPMREMVQYHAARAQDDGLIWLRRQILDEPLNKGSG